MEGLHGGRLEQGRVGSRRRVTTFASGLGDAHRALPLTLASHPHAHLHRSCASSAMVKLTPELIESVPSSLNPLKERQLDLRGEQHHMTQGYP